MSTPEKIARERLIDALLRERYSPRGADVERQVAATLGEIDDGGVALPQRGVRRRSRWAPITMLASAATLLLVLYIYPDGTDGSGAHGPTKVSFHCVDRFWNDTHGLFPPLDKDNKTLGYSHRGVSLVNDGRDPFIIKAAGGAGLQQDEFRV